MIPDDLVNDSADEHEALLQFLYLVPVGLVQTDCSGQVSMMNPAAARLLMPLAPGGNLENLFDSLSPVAPDIRQVARQPEPERGTLCVDWRIPLRASVVTEAGAAAEGPTWLGLTLVRLDAERLMAVLTDLTQTVQQERLLRQGQAWFQAVLAGVSSYAMASVDHQGRVLDWNASLGRLTGWTPEQVVGQSINCFYPPGNTTQERIFDRLREADANGWDVEEGWWVGAGDRRFWGSLMLAPLDHPDECPPDRRYAMIWRDASEQQASAEALRRAITTDHLTDLPNRRVFFETAERELARFCRSPRPMALAIIDCDHFKHINDRYGHPGGDEVLRQIASCLRGEARPVDLLARLGGEEFAVCLPSAPVDWVQAWAERLRARVAGLATHHEGRDIHCTISMGVVLVDADDPPASLDDLIRLADRALYRAKAGGRNRVCWAQVTEGRTGQTQAQTELGVSAA